MADWPLQDAKNRFSAVVNAALAGVLAVDEYERLCRLEKTHTPTLAALLLAIPQDDQEFDRLPLPSRTLDL